MQNELNGKIYLQKLQTFAYLCLGVPLIFFIYIYLESSVDGLEEIIPSQYHLAILFPLAIACVAILYLNQKKFKANVEQYSNKPGLRAKLEHYQQANNSRFLTYGICALMIGTAFFLTNFQPFAAFFGIMLVLFSIYNPNAKRIVQDLRLKGREKEIILNGLDIP